MDFKRKRKTAPMMRVRTINYPLTATTEQIVPVTMDKKQPPSPPPTRPPQSENQELQGLHQARERPPDGEDIFVAPQTLPSTSHFEYSESRPPPWNIQSRLGHSDL
jgi:hypothetical protein